MLKTGEKRHNNIFLTGFMGSGKSTVGPLLARGLRFGFTDTDRLIEKQEKMSVSAVFLEKGEIYYRKVESRMIKKVCQMKNQVVALGGGAILNSKNLNRIKKSGTLIYLKAPATSLARRVRGRSRPLLHGCHSQYSKVLRIRSLLKIRRRHYERAHLQISTRNLTARQVQNRILSEIL